MDKQKQMIEEMAKDICGNFGVKIENLCGPLAFKCDCKCKWFAIAERFYKAGYRKIPEGAVVILDEEMEEFAETLLKSPQIQKTMNGLIKAWEKETAEKFAERVKMAFYYEFDELIPSIMADKIDEICKEIVEEKV